VTDPVEPTNDPDQAEHPHQLLIRLAAGGVALVLVAAAAWILLANRHPTRSVQAYCNKIAAAETLRNALATGDAQEIRAAVDQFQGAVDVAPLEIAPQTQTLVDYAQELASTLATTGGSEAETRAALTEAVRRLDNRSADVTAAGRAVDTYARDTCHLDPGATSPTTR